MAKLYPEDCYGHVMETIEGSAILGAAEQRGVVYSFPATRDRWKGQDYVAEESRPEQKVRDIVSTCSLTR
jgi:hypothetical protein